MKQKILIIEDDTNIRENVAEILSLHGFNISVAKNGITGIEKAINEMPQLIFCDILMPEKNGFQVLTALKENPETCHIPIVFLTSCAQKNDIEKGQLAGVDHYITKPFHTQQLLDTIKKVSHEIRFS